MSDFTTTKPAFRLGPCQQVGADGYREIDPKVVPGFSQPIKTHQVWTSILWPFETTNTVISVNHSNLMVFDPLQIILSSDGFALAHIDLNVNTGSLIPYVLGKPPTTTLYSPGTNPTNMTLHGSDPLGLWGGFNLPFPFGTNNGDISIHVPRLSSPQSLVESYGDWHVTAILGNAPDPVSDGQYLRITMAQGSPYIYCEHKGLSDHLIFNIKDGAKLWYENKNIFIFKDPSNNQTYAIFGPSGSYFDYTFADPLNRLIKINQTSKLKLFFSDLTSTQFFSIAILPYQLIGNLIYARPEVGPANNKYSDYRTLFGIPFYKVGTNNPSPTADLVSFFFGQYGGIIRGELSDGVKFPPPAGTLPWSASDYKKLYDFTNPNSSDYPLFQAIQFFEQHAFSFPIDTAISWIYDQSNAEVRCTYSVTTSLKRTGIGTTGINYSSDTLITLKPHHYKYLKNSDGLLSPNYAYTSARGPSYLMKGHTFETTYSYTGFVPEFPDLFTPYEKSDLNSWLGYFEDSFTPGDHPYEISAPSLVAASGTYTTGKALGRFTQLLPALTIMQKTDLKTRVMRYLNIILSNWFDPIDVVRDKAPQGAIKLIQGAPSASDSTVCYFHYNEKWNTLIGYPADFYAGTDLNDHHFHYGYFIHAMAYILLFGDVTDKAWVLSHSAIIEMMIRDCANWDRSDSMFPFLRFFNAFSGHFSASGWSLGSGNQESTSEAMNFAAGVLLWGYLTNNPTIRDLGIFLYTSQKVTLQEYWFDIDGTNFPKQLWWLDTEAYKNRFIQEYFYSDHFTTFQSDFMSDQCRYLLTNTYGSTYDYYTSDYISDYTSAFFRYDYNRPTISILKSASGEFATFFGAQPVFIYGIQYLPITHASTYLGLMPEKLLTIDSDLLPATKNFLNQGISYNSDALHTAKINFSSFYLMWNWADIFAEVRALYNPSQAVIDLAKLGLYKTESTIPLEYRSDRPATSAPAQPLVHAVYPPFSDTPLGEAGESKAHTYYWIHALSHLGVIQKDLVADIEMAVAFGPTQGNPQNFLVHQYVPSDRKVKFYHRNSGQQYCFKISDGPRLYHFTRTDALPDCTTECPEKDWHDDVEVVQGTIVTLGGSKAPGATYLWHNSDYFLGSIHDFPVQAQPLETTTYYLEVQSPTPACSQHYTITVHVTHLPVAIRNLTYPQTVCFSDPINISFHVSDNDNGLPVHYTLSGGVESDLTGTTTTNTTVSLVRHASDVSETLDYKLFVFMSDEIPVSDQQNFSVFVKNCEQSDTFVCPSIKFSHDLTINQGAFAVLGDAPAADTIYRWYSDKFYTNYLSSDFPLYVRPMSTTTYYVSSQSTIRPNCSDKDSITVRVNSGTLKISQLHYPATICKSDHIDIAVDFVVTGTNLYTNQIFYTVIGDGGINRAGSSTTDTPISLNWQIPSLESPLNYTITTRLSDLATCSDRVGFQIGLVNCTQAPVQSTSSLNIVILIFSSLFALILFYLSYSAFDLFF